MSEQSENINKSALYSELSKFTQKSDYERALKSANKILHNFPEEKQAFHYKVSCLIHLSRFSDVALQFQKFPMFTQGLEFEKAYALYRLNKVEEALDTLNNVIEPPLKVLELKAQVYYRLDRYEEALEVYREVIKSSSDDYDEERETNLSAILANLQAVKLETVPLPSFSIATYEFTYNMACYLIAQGKYAEAEKKLKEAEELCIESFDDDSAQEDIDEEVGIIRLQLAYCFHMMGREKEAQQIYNTFIKNKPEDIGMLAVASNNSVCINGSQNLFDSKKKIKNATSEAAQFKLNARQRKQIAINNCLLNVYTSQSDQILELTDRLVHRYPETEEVSVMMRAAVLTREGKSQEGIKVLKDYAHANPDKNVDMHLAVAQILINESNIEEACETLKNMGSSTYKPGIVSAIVALTLKLGKPNDASKILEKAVAWHRKNKIAEDNLSALWRHAADLHLRSGQAQIAANSLEELLKVNPKDVKTLAQLIIAYAQFNVQKANSLSNKLPKLIDLTPDMDVDTIESTNWLMGAKAMKKVNKFEASPGTPFTDKRKLRSKRHKKRLPKNYDPNTDPDPERWLPLYERSTFRKKKDRRNKDVGKGTQGTSTPSSDQYDITKMTPTTPKDKASSPEEGTKLGSRKMQTKKKKKSVVKK